MTASSAQNTPFAGSRGEAGSGESNVVGLRETSRPVQDDYQGAAAKGLLVMLHTTSRIKTPPRNMAEFQVDSLQSVNQQV
jgi:hypothetical protein